MLVYLSDQKNCSETPDICRQHATCSRVTPEVCAAERPISYGCVCNQGYTGDGIDCQGELMAKVVTLNDISFISCLFNVSCDRFFACRSNAILWFCCYCALLSHASKVLV